MADLPARVALVYDRVNKWGGAERVLLALHEIFPRAPLFTAVYDEKKAGWAKVFPLVIPSFLNRLPGIKSHHEKIPFLTPLAFESFNFAGYDAVISVTSADAKGIITQPATFHLCYCLTPTRYLWSHYDDYRRGMSLPAKIISWPVFNYLKEWDTIASSRPDSYISISGTVRSRVKKYYHRDSPVVFPPVDTAFFTGSQNFRKNDYFLWVSRLVAYKRPELVINAFNRLKKPLIVVGTGSMEGYLKQIAGPNIEFRGFVDDSEMRNYYRHAKALIYYHEEDFGITPVEAMAAGTPVIALNLGGAAETVIPGVTGMLSDDPSVNGLVDLVNAFEEGKFKPRQISDYARKYSRERFLSEFVKVYSPLWHKYRTTYSF